jgi:hypothetical protein
MESLKFTSKRSDLDFNVFMSNENLFILSLFKKIGIDPKGCEIELVSPNIEVSWELYVEIRKYGIKDIGVYATKIDLNIDVDYRRDAGQFVDYVNIEMNEYIKDFEINSDSMSVSQYFIDDIEIDFKEKKINVNFNY